MAETGGHTLAGDEVRPYRIHIPTKHLDLTTQKLELTRLPHEGSAPKSTDWWEPKPLVEPIIDYWLEKYSWRDQESALNQLPQFRTAISLPSVSDTPPLRVHFIHVRSSHGNAAVPLLVLPPFPLTNLSLGQLIQPLAEPDDATHQPFHVVIPSLPGLGFSDALPNNTPPIAATADLLDALMARLAYPHYLVTKTAPARLSPGQIDWKLIDCLATRHAASCLGAHLIAPPLGAPTIRDAPWEWAKWSVARLLRAGVLGYSHDDFAALERTKGKGKRKGKGKGKHRDELELELREPNTLAYALCDSPTGMLAVVLKGLRRLEPRAALSHEQIVTLANLAWLPGPESAMRFWAHCAAHPEERRSSSKSKPKVAITVFTGSGDESIPTAAAASDLVLPQALLSGTPEPVTTTTGTTAQETPGGQYTCPAWANAHYAVAYTQRVPGRAGGLLALEQPGVIAAGARGLAVQVLQSADGGKLRLQQPQPESQPEPQPQAQQPSTQPPPPTAAAATAPTTAPLERVVVEPATPGPGPVPPQTQTQTKTQSNPTPKDAKLDTPHPQPPPLPTSVSGETQVSRGSLARLGSDESTTSKDKGKGKATATLMPPPSASGGASPDTLVGHSPSASSPLEPSSPSPLKM
ncbi:epoxide hydrolase [Cercophora scortea]|uniref:Epoxide hydrolase n=1 Tax=Cercophora scortea TaxID=314031 RepID=A0AAE0MCU7_9PEZI|nr:epoxide hydrolase [Cercophora scortea]